MCVYKHVHYIYYMFHYSYILKSISEAQLLNSKLAAKRNAPYRWRIERSRAILCIDFTCTFMQLNMCSIKFSIKYINVRLLLTTPQ